VPSKTKSPEGVVVKSKGRYQEPQARRGVSPDWSTASVARPRRTLLLHLLELSILPGEVASPTTFPWEGSAGLGLFTSPTGETVSPSIGALAGSWRRLGGGGLGASTWQITPEVSSSDAAQEKRGHMGRHWTDRRVEKSGVFARSCLFFSLCDSSPHWSSARQPLGGRSDSERSIWGTRFGKTICWRDEPCARWTECLACECLQAR